MPNQNTVQFDVEAAKGVLARHSQTKDAARELGISACALNNRFRRRGLHAPDFLAKVALPVGMEIKALHTRTDSAGEIVGQTVIAQRESRDPPKYEPIPSGHYIKGMSTYVGPEGNVRGQWVKTDHERLRREQEFWKACEAATERYKGIAEKTQAPKKCDADLHVILPIGDAHIGMMSWAPETGAHFDLKIAETELFAVVDDLVERSPAAEEATILDLGDFIHAQNDKQVTPTSGHKLDVDGRAAKVWQVCFNLKRRVAARALRRFKRVRMPSVPGNHDPDFARMTALYLRAVYEREPRIEIPDNFNPFYYWTFGKNLFGTVHGNEIKLDQLPGIMAHDVPELWGQTTHRFWHTGHVHHDQAKEYPGVMVHTWRTLAPNDSYAHSHGYRSGKSLCAIAYHRDGGEVSRVSVDLGCVQRRIAGAA